MHAALNKGRKGRENIKHESRHGVQVIDLYHLQRLIKPSQLKLQNHQQCDSTSDLVICAISCLPNFASTASGCNAIAIETHPANSFLLLSQLTKKSVCPGARHISVPLVATAICNWDFSLVKHVILRFLRA